MTINSLKIKLTAIAAGLTPVLLSAQDNAKGEVVTQTVFSNGVFLVMLGVIVMLAFVIIGMSEFVKAGASLKVKQSKAEGNSSKNTVAMIAFLLLSVSAMAQDAAAPAADAAAIPEVPFDYWGLGVIDRVHVVSYRDQFDSQRSRLHKNCCREGSFRNHGNRNHAFHY
jgi:hypothetical protein